MKKFPMVELITRNGNNANLHFLDQKIIIQSPDTAAQWEPDTTAVQVFNYGTHFQITFTTAAAGGSVEQQNSQSFFYEPGPFYKVCDFFRGLGFPENCFSNLAIVEVA